MEAGVSVLARVLRRIADRIDPPTYTIEQWANDLAGEAARTDSPARARPAGPAGGAMP